MSIDTSESAIPQYGLDWENRSFYPAFVHPVWSTEPDIQAIKSVVVNVLKDDDIKIEFLAQGAFNKVYKIHDTSKGSQYIMRVSLPLDPHHKTSSEVTTMQYIKETTNLPVPTVIAYDASPDNIIGFEWILMSLMPGMPLNTRWVQLSLTEKRAILTQIATYSAEMFEKCRFKSIGSLQRDASGAFETSRMSDMLIWWYKRVHDNSVSKGPFTTAQEWMKSTIQLVYNENHRLHDLAQDDDDREVWYFTRDNARRLIDALPELFDDPSVAPVKDDAATETTVLIHNDLNPGNILINPETLEITGIIDWENMSAVPIGIACSPPDLITGLQPRDTEPDHEAYWVSDDEDEREKNFGKSVIYTEHLMQWQDTQLKPFFNEEMRRICPEWINEYEKGEGLRDLYEVVRDCDNQWFARYVGAWLGWIEYGNKQSMAWIKDERSHIRKDDEGEEDDNEDTEDQQESTWTPAMMPYLIGSKNRLDDEDVKDRQETVWTPAMMPFLIGSKNCFEEESEVDGDNDDEHNKDQQYPIWTPAMLPCLTVSKNCLEEDDHAQGNDKQDAGIPV